MTTTTISTRRRTTAPASIPDRLLRYLGRAAARRELASLNAAQLRDVGIDPSQVRSGPVFEVDAGAMIRLMSQH